MKAPQAPERGPARAFAACQRRTATDDAAVRSVLIARSAFGDVYEPALCRALNEIGVECRIFDTHAYISHGLLGRLEQRVLLGPGIARANDALVGGALRQRPDVTLLYQGHHFHGRTIERLAALTFVAGMHNDDPFSPRNVAFRYRLLRKALANYDGYHVYRDCNVADFLRAGVPRVKVLMPGFIPWLDHPRTLRAEEQRRWGSDVVFAGHFEPDQRVACLVKLVRTSVRVRLLGERRFWRSALPHDVLRKMSAEEPAYGEDYRKALCGAKIAACFFSKWNRDQYTRRSFEIPACGAFLLAERTPAMEELYDEGKEAEYFASADEFVEKALFYLKDDGARERIAEAGYRRATTSGYDVFSRMRQWVQDVTEWRREAASESVSTSGVVAL